MILPIHRFPVLAEIPDKRYQEVPFDGIVRSFADKVAVDIPVKPDVLVQQVMNRKTQAGHVVLEQLPVYTAIPFDGVVILFKHAGLLPEVELAVAADLHFPGQGCPKIQVMVLRPVTRNHRAVERCFGNVLVEIGPQPNTVFFLFIKSHRWPAAISIAVVFVFEAIYQVAIMILVALVVAVVYHTGTYGRRGRRW